MTARPFPLVLLAVLLVALTLVAAVAPVARAAGTTSVTGSITGPTVVAWGSTSKYAVSGFGGPAVSSNGTVVGNLTYYASLVAGNLTGLSFLPSKGSFTSNASVTADLAVTNVTQTVTIHLLVSSVYQGTNRSTNLTYTVNVVQPYILSATLVDAASWVNAFTLYVTLDGTVIGNVSIPGLSPGGTYPVKFEYSTLGLPAGSHTFAISLAQEHGLIKFANGQTEYTETVYVTGPGPDYTIWYVGGIVTFFGALFIFASRVAARRRGATRR